MKMARPRREVAMRAPNSRVGPPSPQAGALPELPQRLHGRGGGWGGGPGFCGYAQGLVLRWRRLWGACPGESEGGRGFRSGQSLSVAVMDGRPEAALAPTADLPQDPPEKPPQDPPEDDGTCQCQKCGPQQSAGPNPASSSNDDCPQLFQER